MKKNLKVEEIELRPTTTRKKMIIKFRYTGDNDKMTIVNER